MDVIAVAVGSALGGMARFCVSGIVGRRIGETFPWGTLAVNISGALLLGLVAGAAGAPGDRHIGPFVVAGFLGSYTTVSSFSLQTLTLAQAGARRHAAANIALSVGGCLAAAALGLFAGASLAGGL